MPLCFNWSLVSTFWCPQNFSINSANHCGKIHLKKIMLQNVNVVTQRRDFLISIFCNVPITELKRKSLKRTGKNHFQLLLLLSHCILQCWLYYCEHLKYVWNVYCVVTNHMQALYTTETTSNERFPIGHGTNYFRFVLTFILQVNNSFSSPFVYSMCYNSEEYRFEWFWGLLSQCARRTHVMVWRANFQTFCNDWNWNN